MAEAFYTQLLDDNSIITDEFVPTNTTTLSHSALNSPHPVTVIEGITHMQFASGTPTEHVFNNDPVPEKSYAEAHILIARDFTDFIYMHLVPDNKEAVQTIQRRLLETNTFVAPIIDALHMEGYHNFRPPCICEAEVCKYSTNCTASCPFTSIVSQPAMGWGIEGLVINDTNSLRSAFQRAHKPSVNNSCTGDQARCMLHTISVTEGAYMLSFGTSEPGGAISANELKTKLNSRQSIYASAGAWDPSLKELVDGTGVRCGEINQKSIDWASQHASGRTMDRFNTYGQRYTIGPDIDVCPTGV
jgi:hypothetical protein